MLAGDASSDCLIAFVVIADDWTNNRNRVWTKIHSIRSTDLNCAWSSNYHRGVHRRMARWTFAEHLLCHRLGFQLPCLKDSNWICSGVVINKLCTVLTEPNPVVRRPTLFGSHYWIVPRTIR
jgi:hypothetical protein